MFDEGMSPMEAIYKIEINQNKLETMDRKCFPQKNDCYRLFYKYRNCRWSADNGPEMFAKLDQIIKN